jgi:hypothetical protein
MKSFLGLIGAIIQILIYLIIFAIQVLAPLMTLIFLIVTFINPTSANMTIFYVSSISYFIGYLTSSLGVKSVVPIYEKSQLDLHHPLIGTLIDMAIMFLPSFISALVICLIIGDFSYYLHNAIMVNWLYRVIRLFMKKYKGGNSYRFNDNSNAVLEKNTQKEDSSNESNENEDEDFNLEDFFENRKKDLIFTAETMAQTYNLLREKKKLPINSAMFGTAVLSERTWIEADLTNIGEVMLDIIDAIQGKCMVGDYEKKHSPELDFDEYEDLLVNLVMSVCCVNININKPQIEASKVVDYIVDNKKLIGYHVKQALKENFTIDSMWITMNEINVNNGYPNYEDVIKKAMKNK